MQSRHLLIPLLIVAHVLIGLVVWSLGDIPEHGQRLFLAVVAASQVNLLAIWTALGRRAAPWRLVALVAAVVGWSWIEASVTGDDPYWVGLLLPTAATLVAVLAVARFSKLRLHITDADHTYIEDDRPWQFSLGHLFAWTTSLAICLGLLSLTFRHCHDWNGSNLSKLPAITIGSTVVVLICCLSLASIAHLRQGLVALLLSLVLLAFVFERILPVLIHPSMGVFVGLQIPVIVATLLVCRMAGYRMSWKRKNS